LQGAVERLSTVRASVVENQSLVSRCK